MSIVLVGLNHKSAPVEVRERLAFSDDACSEALRALVDGAALREGLIVSTCNRVEVVATTGSVDSSAGATRISNFLGAARNVPPDFFHAHLYTHAEDAAVRHVFRVA